MYQVEELLKGNSFLSHGLNVIIHTFCKSTTSVTNATLNLERYFSIPSFTHIWWGEIR